MLNSRSTTRSASFVEKRNGKRTPLGLKGKVFVPSHSAEEDCFVVDLSPHGAGIKCSGSLPIDTQIVLYVDGFGRFEGTVVDRHRMRVGVRFHSSSTKRNRTAEQLLEFVASGKAGNASPRDAIRMKEIPALHQFTDASGHCEGCEVIDIALGGASLKTQSKPELGSFLHFGVTIARVVRHTDQGIAVAFIGRSRSDQPT